MRFAVKIIDFTRDSRGSGLLAHREAKLYSFYHEVSISFTKDRDSQYTNIYLHCRPYHDTIVG